MRPDGRAANTPSPDDRHVLQPRFCAGKAAEPSSLSKNATAGGSSPRTEDAEQSRRGPRPRALVYKVSRSGHREGCCRPPTVPSQGSDLMKEIKVPTTRGHCAGL